ncbi:rhodanese-like domain-containing protein [Butyrivibrio sp. VCB2006]|uniref:rhodanese-like domain-containing protein n=1 Tax=Butyrivibrio sp. VCB2006 TaxID=1280679 RepID=UPI0004925AEF|nr:rhodanese-like domain-containing protein [Butyrivibrio sp. VCB2006]
MTAKVLLILVLVATIIPVCLLFGIIKDHDAEIYVYCLRGSRSISAVKKLKTFGYKRARSIGGIASYKGLTVLD